MYIKSRIGWQRLTKDEYQTEGDYYLITGTDIDEVTHTIDLNRSYYVSKERYEKDSNIQVIEGDIIVTKDGTIGKVAMVCGLDKPATFNSHLFVLRDLSGKLNNRFLLHILDSPIFEKFVEASKTGSTLTGLPQKTMVEFEFKVPSVEEQKMISCYFDILDHLSTLHQRKPIPHPNHPTIHTKHKGEEKYVRIRVNDRGKINRTANLRRFPVDIPGGFKDGGRSVGEFQIYSGAE